MYKLSARVDNLLLLSQEHRKVPVLKIAIPFKNQLEFWNKIQDSGNFQDKFLADLATHLCVNETHLHLRNVCQATCCNITARCVATEAGFESLRAKYDGQTDEYRCDLSGDGDFADLGCALILRRFCCQDRSFELVFEGSFECELASYQNLLERLEEALNVERPFESLKIEDVKPIGEAEAGLCPEGHLLVPFGTSRDNGWGCDGRHEEGGCLSGITGFGQSAGINRFCCNPCDFDYCEKCYVRRAGAKHCSNGHPLIPLGTTKNTGWVCNKIDEGCKRGDKTKGVNRYRCEECDYDLCDICHQANALWCWAYWLRSDDDEDIKELLVEANCRPDNEHKAAFNCQIELEADTSDEDDEDGENGEDTDDRPSESASASSPERGF